MFYPEGVENSAELVPSSATAVVPDAADQPDFPHPEPATEAVVRAALGQRRPVGTPRGIRAVPAVDRLDLLLDALDAETAAVAVLWLAGTKRGSNATRRSYADDLLAWADWCRRERGRDRLALRGPSRLTRQDVSLWLLSEQALNRSPATIARRLASLSSLYRYAAGWGLPVVSPINDDDHRPKITRGRRATSARVLSADQVQQMLAASSDSRDALVVALLFTDALRVSEMCAANLDDVHDEGRRCWLVITRKGGNQILVTLDPGICELLDAYSQQRAAWIGVGPAPLIVDADGQRLDRHDVLRMLRRLARAAGIPRPETVTPHSLRATAITDLIDRGRPITEVQEISGHGDIRTVMVYVEQHGRDERVTAMVSDLARVLAAVPDRFRRRATPHAGAANLVSIP